MGNTRGRAHILLGFLCRSRPRRLGRDRLVLAGPLSRPLDSPGAPHGVRRPRLRVRAPFVLFRTRRRRGSGFVRLGYGLRSWSPWYAGRPDL